MRCILIDDDHDDQEIFTLALSQVKMPVDCTVIDDAIEALRRLAELNNLLPDYIFVDVNMHKMNGMQVLAEIRKMEKLNATRVIMFSTSGDIIIRQASRTLGADDFLIKPAGLNLLVEMLDKIFQNSIPRVVGS